MTTHWWYDWGGLNQHLFLWINHAGSGWTWDHLAAWGAVAGDYFYYPLWAALALALALKRPNLLSTRAVLCLLVAYVVDALLVGSLKPWLSMPRPLLVLGPAAVHVIGPPKLFHSFPSGHTAFAFTVMASLLPGAHWVLRALLVVFALWVGWSRIAVGAHFPADVLGGALIGLLSAWLSSQALNLAGYARR
jgi:undecaprenyl-diphosphatase